jgi:hypothetical protein
VWFSNFDLQTSREQAGKADGMSTIPLGKVGEIVKAEAKPVSTLRRHVVRLFLPGVSVHPT